MAAAGASASSASAHHHHGGGSGGGGGLEDIRVQERVGGFRLQVNNKKGPWGVVLCGDGVGRWEDGGGIVYICMCVKN